jgi:hypothetical protein
MMEYLAGETMAARLKKGAVPISQVLLHGIDVPDAPDKAHRKDITHRALFHRAHAICARKSKLGASHRCRMTAARCHEASRRLPLR